MTNLVKEQCYVLRKLDFVIMLILLIKTFFIPKQQLLRIDNHLKIKKSIFPYYETLFPLPVLGLTKHIRDTQLV